MFTSKKIIPLLIVVIGFVLATIAIPYMPPFMASHWGISGDVDGYMPKITALFTMPLISLVLYFLFRLLPKLEPYQKNFTQFEEYFDNFMIVIFSFLLYIYILTLAWNYGFVFSFTQFMSPGLAILFFFTASLLESTKRNWFVGIRTPWTMMDETVWKKTHKLGSFLFKIIAIFTLIGMVFPNLAFYFFIIPLTLVIPTIYLYSYLEYRKTSHGSHSKR